MGDEESAKKPAEGGKEGGETEEVKEISLTEEVKEINYEAGQLQIRRKGEKDPNRGWIVLRGICVYICVLILLFLAVGGLIYTSFWLDNNVLAAQKRREEAMAAEEMQNEE